MQQQKPHCEECNLYAFCTHPKISARGTYDDPLAIIIGEAPGPREDEEGRVFVGRSGQKLSEVLGENEDKVYITNCVKCCPYVDPHNQDNGFRTPTPQEIEWCKPLLFKELNAFDPSKTVIITLGNSPLTALIGKHKGIEKEIGVVKVVEIDNKMWRVYPTYHPSYILRGKIGSSYDNEFQSVIRQALSHDTVTDEEGEVHLIATPSEAIREAKLVIEAYQDREIEFVVYDCETTGFLPWKHKVIMHSFHAEGVTNKAVAVPLQISNIVHHENFIWPVSKIDISISEKDKAQINSAIGNMIEIVPIVGHLLKFDISMAVVSSRIAKLEKIKVFFDTLLLAHVLIGRQEFGALDLKTLCVKLFGVSNWELPVDAYIKAFRRVEDRTYDKIPTSILGEYAAKDAYYNHALAAFLIQQITEENRPIIDIIHGILPVFIEAEIKGVYFDTSIFNYIQEAYNKMASAERAIMASLIQDWFQPKMKAAIAENSRKKNPLPLDLLEEKTFNPSSTQQRASILFDFFQMPDVDTKHRKPITDNKMKNSKYRKITTNLIEGPLKDDGDGKPKGTESRSTDKDVIEKLMKDKRVSEEGKQFLAALSNYTGLKKLITSYLENTEEILEGSIYHPNYQINGTITGRHSSGFHTLPKKSDIKRLYISRWRNEGGLFACFDFSQLELRVVASLANELKWIKAFEDGIDIHTSTASVAFGVPFDKVSSDQRRAAKVINFGLIYGLSDKGLAEGIGCDLKQAGRLKQGLFDGCTGLSSWFQQCYDYVDKHHEITTVFGRTIPINMKNFKGEEDKEANHRRSVNYSVQSPASDLVSDSIGRIYRLFKGRNIKSIIVGSVHDSILVDIYPGELPTIIKIIKYVCEVECHKLYQWIKCPIIVDTSFGTSWGGCIDFKVGYDSRGYILKGDGLRKDFSSIFSVCEGVYNWQYEILKIEEIEKQPRDKVIKDKYSWEVEIVL